jgi:hypothetical protein
VPIGAHDSCAARVAGGRASLACRERSPAWHACWRAAAVSSPRRRTSSPPSSPPSSRSGASALIAIPGCGALTAAKKILGETAGMGRFRFKDASARHNGTAPQAQASAACTDDRRGRRGAAGRPSCNPGIASSCSLLLVPWWRPHRPGWRSHRRWRFLARALNAEAPDPHPQEDSLRSLPAAPDEPGRA